MKRQSFLASSCFPEAKGKKRKEKEYDVCITAYFCLAKHICMCWRKGFHRLVTKSLRLGLLVGSLGVAQAHDRNIRLTHQHGGASPKLSRDPGLEQQLLKVGRGETQLHFTSGNPILDIGTWPQGMKT